MAELTSLGVRSLRVGAGLSTRKAGLGATEEALAAALLPLRGALPDLAFLFVAPQFEDELEPIVQSVNASLGGGVLLGCVAGGSLRAGGATSRGASRVTSLGSLSSRRPW